MKLTDAQTIELSAGTMDYTDTGGDGPVLVFVARLMMDASLWDETIAELSADHRCVAPTLPLGADLSLPGIARLVGEFLDRLNMHEVTLSATTPAGRSPSCSWPRTPPRWPGWCPSPATRSTTSRPG